MLPKMRFMNISGLFTVFRGILLITGCLPISLAIYSPVTYRIVKLSGKVKATAMGV